MEYNKDKVDEVILALLYLTRWTDQPVTRAWKSHDCVALERLHERGLISDPRGKAKSVVLTKEGAQKSEDLFWRLFGESST